MWRMCLLVVCLASLVVAEEQPKPAEAARAEMGFKVDEASGAFLVSFEVLNLRKALSLEKLPDDVEKHLPERLAKLNGKSVRMTGWMYPPAQETELTAFIFVADNMAMHFGRPFMSMKGSAFG